MRKSREGIGRLGAVLSLCLALALSGIPVSAEPKAGTEKTETEKMPDVPLTEHTQAEAVEWLHHMVGRSVDYDGAYGAQCVDFIKAYYAWLPICCRTGSPALKMQILCPETF